MEQRRDKDTRYFVDLDRQSLSVRGHGYDQKQNLNKGRQIDPAVHRLFLTKGQYRKFVERCAAELERLG